MLKVGADVPTITMVRAGIETATGTFVTAFDAPDLYGAGFLGDLVLASAYADAGIVGKAAHYVMAGAGEAPRLLEPSSEYRHVTRLASNAWLARRELFDGNGGSHLLNMHDGGLVVTAGNGVHAIYSSDAFNDVRAAALDGTARSAFVAGAPDGFAALRCAEILI